MTAQPPRSAQVSFEFFPPRTPAMEKRLWAAIGKLAPLAPSFVSVTYGAGGSTRQRTHETVTQIGTETGLAVAAHLTCVGSSRDEIESIARHYWDSGIRHLVALRGDQPEGISNDVAQGDYPYASDLVVALRRIADFELSVAAYPEGHPQARDASQDLDNLKRKIDAGATRAITQFFFDNDAFLRFRERAAKAGIGVPIIPGILPVTNVARTLQFAEQCNASIPNWFPALFDGLDDDLETLNLVAATVAAEQCRRLRDEGVDDFHFYTLNRAALCFAICRLLGIQPATAVAA